VECTSAPVTSRISHLYASLHCVHCSVPCSCHCLALQCSSILSVWFVAVISPRSTISIWRQLLLSWCNSRDTTLKLIPPLKNIVFRCYHWHLIDCNHMKLSSNSLCTFRTFFILLNTWSSLSKMSSAINTVFLSRFSVMDSMPHFRQIIQSSFDVKHLVRSCWSVSFCYLITRSDVMNWIDYILLLLLRHWILPIFR
jgi:hypothetical protein